MTGWLAFDGRIETIDRQGVTYTILPLPDAVATALGAAKRVEAELGDHPANLAVNRTSERPEAFLWAGQSLLDAAGLVPGETVAVRLRPAPDDHVDTPPDLSAALRAAGATATWESLSPGKRRGALYQIDTARTAATRAKRIGALAEALAGGAGAGPAPRRR